MLVPTPILHLGSNFFNSGSHAAVDIVLMSAIPAHQLALVRLASGALGGSNGVSDEHTLTDSLGSVYTKLAEVTRLDDTGGFRPGVTVSLWMLRPTHVIPVDTALVGTFSAAVACGVIAADLYDTFSALNTLTLEGIDADDGSTGGVSFPAIQLVLGASDDFLWAGTLAYDGSTSTTTAPLAEGWAWDREPVLNAGSNFTGLTLLGQYRIVETLEQLWTVEAASDRRWGIIMAAFSLTAPPLAAPTPGTRRLLADFDTATDGGVETSSIKRPDAVSLDYLRAFTIGPPAFLDPWATVPFDREWYARATEDLTVRVAVSNSDETAWGEESELFTYTGAAIVELDFAIDRNGRPVVVAERPTGDADGPEVWVYAWDEDLTAFVFAAVDDGRTPRCCLEAFPHLSPHCEPTPDVQLLYLRPGPPPFATGLVRRESTDAFATRFSTPLPYVGNIWLEDVYPTSDRRLEVVYSRRDLVHGELELRFVDSTPYTDSLLNRPSFNPYRVNDLVWYRGSLYVGAVATADYSLRATTLEAVDAIELQCSNQAPVGYQPSQVAFPWDKQVLESPSSVAAGASYDFTVSVTHGLGGMAPAAFRLRTRKVVGAATCYSPWRYYIPVRWEAGGGVSSLLVNCAHDVIVTHGHFEIGHGGLGPHFCDAEAHVSTSGGPGSTFVGGWNPGIGGGWRQDWAVQQRNVLSALVGWPGFWDDDVAFLNKIIVGSVYASSGSGNGWPMSDPDQCPIQIPSPGIVCLGSDDRGGTDGGPTIDPPVVPPGGGVPRPPAGGPIPPGVAEPPPPSANPAPPVPSTLMPPGGWPGGVVPSTNPGGIDFGNGASIRLALADQVGLADSVGSAVSRAAWDILDPTMIPSLADMSEEPPPLELADSPDAWDANLATGWSSLADMRYGELFGVWFAGTESVGRIRLRLSGHIGEFPPVVQIMLLDATWEGFGGAPLPIYAQVVEGTDDCEIVLARNWDATWLLLVALPALGDGSADMPARPFSVDELDIYTLDDSTPYQPPEGGAGSLYVYPGANELPVSGSSGGGGLVPFYADRGLAGVGSRIYLATPTEYAGLVLPTGAVGWITMVNGSADTPNFDPPSPIQRRKYVVPYYYQLSSGNSVPWPELPYFGGTGHAPPNWKLYAATAAQAALGPALPADAFQYYVAATIDGYELLVAVYPDTWRRLSGVAGYPPVIDGA